MYSKKINNNWLLLHVLFKKHQNAYTIHLSIYSYTHLSIYLSMSRWKEKYFLLTPDYLQCFKKGTSRISEMGSFDYKVIKCKHTQIHIHNHTHLYLMTQFVRRSVVWSVSRLAGSNCHNFQKGQEVSLPCSYRSNCLHIITKYVQSFDKGFTAIIIEDSIKMPILDK